MFRSSPLCIALLLGSLATFSGAARASFDTILDTVAPVDEPNSVEPLGRRETKYRLAVPRSPDGLFYVRIKVNGRPVRFLVDTGSSVVVLTAADARMAGTKIPEGQYTKRAYTVGGATPMAWTKVNSMALAGQEVRDLKVAVVQGGLEVSLLGQNLLVKLGPIAMRENQLVFE